MPSTVAAPREPPPPLVLKTRLASTPALSSPGLFSSPAESHDAYDRCETPVSPTELVIRPRIQHASSSPAPWLLDGLARGKDGGDTDEDATDDDFAYDDEDDEAPMLTDAETSSEWALEPSVEPEPAHSSPAIVDDAALEAAELLLFLAGAPKQPMPVSVPVASTSQLPPMEVEVQMDIDATADAEPVTSSSADGVPPLPSTPAVKAQARAGDAEPGPGELSDLTPLRPSPAPAPAAKRRKPGPRERAQQKKAAATKRDDKADDAHVDVEQPAVQRVRKRKRAAPSPHSSPAKPSPKKRRGPVVIENADADTVAEIEGFLVETLALSRASSMPASQLMSAVLAEQPHLRAARTEAEWLPVFRDILAAFDVFGRARRTGKAADGKPPEDQWYYQPKHDPNSDRALLLAELMRNKRAATMNGDVQYYWKPVPRKVTVRW
ncbi:hypothetical protein AURDEDRAFT_117348 [Auricularia subglabra TFB-10046 SS5]|uniref:Uncharacterized protein n=1 Tax=Auricularia subglabra (strain TFB-10046 / SS5) TaxID=717982 RepID=J0D8H1_AURST|nr:hypothetical protein AURDEDRAFT_117348 [Auricularia subglabra TFB-10046 SS5]